MPLPQSALIVDDEVHIRLFVKLILKELGLTQIREAKNGAEALALYQEQPADIVLMDVNMAGMDGLETLDRFAQQYPDAFVIMLTSSATRQVVEQCIERGARQYIRKDTPRAEMLQLLKATFEENFS
jgi:two-component system chemotaxis response regulator CheY